MKSGCTSNVVLCPGAYVTPYKSALNAYMCSASTALDSRTASAYTIR